MKMEARQKYSGLGKYNSGGTKANSGYKQIAKGMMIKR